MKSIHVPVVAGLILALIAGCRMRDKRKGRFEGWDGGVPPLREECTMPAENCYDACSKRKASITCVGCCRDQRLLCDTQQPHSFQSCESTQ